MKRILRLVVLFALLLGVASLVSAQDTVTLNVVGFVVPLEEQGTPLDEAYQTFIADFEAANPGVDVNALQTPPEFDTQLLVDLAAGTAPDVWNQDASTLARLVDAGYVLDMNECLALVPELNLDRFFPSVLAIHQREEGGPIYGLPNDFTPMVIYYNAAAFERAGVEPPQAGWTWEDLRNIAMQVTLDANGNNATSPDFDPENVVQYGFRVRRFTFEWIYRLWQNGADVISPDGTTASGYLDSPESIEAITFLRDLMLVDRVSPNQTTLDALTAELGFLNRFLRGEFAMFDRGHWELVGLRANPEFTGEGQFGIVGQPQNAARATVLYESGFVIRADIPEEKKEAACRFVEAATNLGYQGTKVLTGIAISGNEAAAAAAIEQSPNPEIEQAFFDEVEFGRAPYGSVYANWPTVESALDSMMERILAGGDVETEVASAVREINRELGR